MRQKLLRDLCDSRIDSSTKNCGANGEIKLEVIACVYIFSSGTDGAEVDSCFSVISGNETKLPPVVWRRFSMADGRRGFERTKTARLNYLLRDRICYRITDRKKLARIIACHPDVLLRFDQPVS